MMSSSIRSGDLDLVTALVAKDLGHVFRGIFKHLSGQSLLNARLACKAWNKHIKRNVYGSAEGRRNLVARFEKNRREGICSRQVVPIWTRRPIDVVADIKMDGG